MDSGKWKMDNLLLIISYPLSIVHFIRVDL